MTLFVNFMDVLFLGVVAAFLFVCFACIGVAKVSRWWRS
jgi:hypothetical protein